MDISHLLRDTVSKAPKTSTSASGDPSYGAVTTIRARVEQQKELKSEDDGQRRDITSVFLTDQSIDSDDVVWLPGENTASVSDGHRIDSIERADPIAGGADLKRVVVK